VGNLTDGRVCDELANLRSSVSPSERGSAKPIACERDGVRKRTEKRTMGEGDSDMVRGV
jgi:hypothetical protein